MSAPPEQTHDGDTPEPRSVRNDGLRRRRSKRGLFERVSIQSKLMLMLLTMSVLAVAIAGGIGFQSGTQSLRASVFDRLTGVREAQSRVLQMGLNNITGSLVVLSRGDIVSSALNAFTAGFEQLADATVTPEQDRALAEYYNTTFERTPDSKLDISALVPTSPAARYLQANYTVPNANRDQPAGLSDARNGSIWSGTNARYDGYFADIVKRLGFRDAFLINAKGDVVYSADKGVELGTNVLTGPYRGEGFLPGAFQKAMASNEIDYIDTTDFSDYLPSGQPTAWMVMPIGPPGRASGVMAVEFSATIVSDLMTGGREWERAGMGRTGETFVVGKDDLMRSDSRLFLQDPEAYKKDVIDAGTPPAVAERALKQGTTVLVQPVGTKATQLAQRGETGTLVATDYLGHRALQAYAPVTLKGLDWVVVATINSDEAFAPQRNFAQKLIRSTAFIIFVACLAAMLWSKLFVRPIRRLEDGAEKISTGDYNVQLPVDSNDEFGDLAVAFNDMSRNLAAKDELLAEQRAENDRLLTSLMPESVVERYRDGEHNIAEEHQDVTVIYADLVGVDELSGGMVAEESLAAINKLVRQFDAAAQSNGVERVRNTHNGYLASCGLTVPRLDNIHRTVDFALEMQRIVNRFNAETGGDIQLRAGIDTGPVTSGLVGSAGLVYDLWGGAVHLASKMRRGQPGIYVSDHVYEATRDTRHYTQAGTVTIADREEPTWRLSEDRP
jgi:class 3 adenylate cyclase